MSEEKSLSRRVALAQGWRLADDGVWEVLDDGDWKPIWEAEAYHPSTDIAQAMAFAEWAVREGKIRSYVLECRRAGGGEIDYIARVAYSLAQQEYPDLDRTNEWGDISSTPLCEAVLTALKK